jgi:hypothetical protein
MPKYTDMHNETEVSHHIGGRALTPAQHEAVLKVARKYEFRYWSDLARYVFQCTCQMNGVNWPGGVITFGRPGEQSQDEVVE